MAGWRISLVALAVVGAACVRLCRTALLLRGGFVGTYNYLTYRLGESPFDLSTSSIGLVFLAYLVGPRSAPSERPAAATRRWGASRGATCARR